jgi:hypothetical protein
MTWQTGVVTLDIHYTDTHTFLLKEKTFILEQAMKAQRGSRGTALLFL